LAQPQNGKSQPGPFNRGAEDGGAGNDVPKDGSHPTSYLWREVLQRDHFLNIVDRFVHLQIEEKEDLRQIVLGSTTWRAMSLSGVGIGMGINPSRYRRIQGGSRA